MSKTCLCLNANTISKDLELVEKYKSCIDFVELRADLLDQEECARIRRFPDLCPFPVILTARRRCDGGAWIEGEAARMILLARGLAFADFDPRKNFAYIDLESDLKVPSIEEAARTFGIKIIRSYHDMRGCPEDMERILGELAHYQDEIPKLAVRINDDSDAARFAALAECLQGRDKIVLGMGECGFFSRVMVERTGSMFTFASEPQGANGLAAPGQLDPETLETRFRFRSIGRDTRFVALAGQHSMDSPALAHINGKFVESGIDARLVPVCSGSAAAATRLAESLGIDELIISTPYKMEACKLCSETGKGARSSGIVSAMRREKGLWYGKDLDSPAMIDTIREQTGHSRLWGWKVVVLGTGGEASSAAGVLKTLGARCLVTDREAAQARTAANRSDSRWAGQDSQGIELLSDYRKLMVKVSRVTFDRETDDPVPFYEFTGREMVMDLTDPHGESAFMKRAVAAGCRILGSGGFFERRSKLMMDFFSRREAAV